MVKKNSSARILIQIYDDNGLSTGESNNKKQFA